LVVAVVGATGVVGEQILLSLDERDFPVERIVPLASSQSAGATVNFRSRAAQVETLTAASFQGIDLAFFSAGAAVSEAFGPTAVEAGTIVVDNSRAFRMVPQIPLVVPEVNADALDNDVKLVANPNCSTIQVVAALAPLHRAAGLKRVVISSYQSASGAGRKAMDELRDQTVALLSFSTPPVEQFQRRLAFDVLPHIDQFEADGFTREEHKMIFETRKILGLADLPVCATCVRVPVFVGHAVSVNVEFERPLDVEAARVALAEADGIELYDGYESYPMAADVVGTDVVHVGRVRTDPSVAHGLALWVMADNLRKGAATNAVQIAEHLLAMGRWG
jgi:aspartate-semialdehyde dehydrogenase